MMVQCCVCKKVKSGHRWVDVIPEQLAYLDISHGYCPKCAEEAFAEILSAKTTPACVRACSVAVG